MPNSPPPSAPAIPLARWAGRQLRQLADESGSAAIAALSGETLLGERAALNGFSVPGKVSAGGGCRLLQASDGWIALNLARPDDRDLLPALFGDAAIDPLDDAAIANAIAGSPCADLLARGRELGLAIASTGETPVSPAVELLAEGQAISQRQGDRPLVVDLSALWAGPLAAHLLWLAGGEVVKVESRSRPDAMRQGDPALFALLNQGKASALADLATSKGRTALIALFKRADIVIEAARPRALRQLGIDAEKVLRTRPGLVWITITGHGASGEAAEWVGFGDDCGVAGALSGALVENCGSVSFVGDAIADPLTGIVAAREAWRHWRSGRSCRIGLSMSSIAAQALMEERAFDSGLLKRELAEWSAAVGTTFPASEIRKPKAALHPLGVDTAHWLGSVSC